MNNVFLKPNKEKKKELIYLSLCLIVYLTVTSLLDITCIIKHLTGISCPGCGMTRALKSLIFLNYSKAFYYHPLVFLLIPITVLLFVFTIRKMYKTRKAFVYVIAILFILVYFYRLIFLETKIVIFEPRSGSIIKFLNRLF